MHFDTTSMHVIFPGPHLLYDYKASGVHGGMGTLIETEGCTPFSGNHTCQWYVFFVVLIPYVPVQMLQPLEPFGARWSWAEMSFRSWERQT